MPNDRRPPLRKRLRYRWDGFGDPDTGVDRWLNRRSKPVRILVIATSGLVLLVGLEVFFPEVLGLDPYPSSDPNEELEREMRERRLPVQLNLISPKQLERLHPGMTVDEATKIVGSPGIVRGADGAGSETRRWLGPKLPHHTDLVFQAGVLVSITQIDKP